MLHGVWQSLGPQFAMQVPLDRALAGADAGKLEEKDADQDQRGEAVAAAARSSGDGGAGDAAPQAAGGAGG